jgi:hypothetical protein
MTGMKELAPCRQATHASEQAGGQQGISSTAAALASAAVSSTGCDAGGGRGQFMWWTYILPDSAHGAVHSPVHTWSM